jgi:hypothetical protein
MKAVLLVQTVFMASETALLPIYKERWDLYWKLVSLAMGRTKESLSADFNLNVLKDTYDHKCYLARLDWDRHFMP